MTTKLIAADASAGAILDPSVGDGALVIQTGAAGAKVDAISITADGTPTFLKVPKNTAVQSMVRLSGSGGFGSTATCIRRYSTTQTNQGADITVADDGANGTRFTINTKGTYSISYSDCFSAQGYLGISLNTSSGSTAINIIAQSEALAIGCTAAANLPGHVSWSGELSIGAVIRPHCTSGLSAGSGSNPAFTITRVA